MPRYDYLCADCGAFDDVQPMRASSLPQPCPGCGAPAPRAILSVPAMSFVSGATRVANATNERSRHAPLSADAYRAKHPAGCGCCRPTGRSKLAADGGGAAKSFPGQRPWMLSH